MAGTKFMTVYSGWHKKTGNLYQEIWVDGKKVLTVEDVMVVDYRNKDGTNVTSQRARVPSGRVHNRPVDRPGR